MPFFDSIQAETAGSISRKRTHAQITRSSSRSVTPPPSKRRRTSINHARHTPSLPRSLTPTPISPFRFAGDGLDFRRPTAPTMEQFQEPTTIDLTQLSDADDDEDNDSIASFLPISSQESRRISSRRRRTRRAGIHSEYNGSQRRAPPFDQIQHNEPPEVIDLSNIDNGRDDPTQPVQGRPVSLSSSPEIQIVGERYIPRRPILPLPTDFRNGGEPPGLQRADAQTFENRSFGSAIQRLTTSLMRGFVGRNVGPPHAGGVAQYHTNWATFGFLPQQMPVPAPLDLEIYSDFDEDYDDIRLDYETGGMVMADLRDQEAMHGPSNYKPPLPAREGFTRNIEDGDAENLLVCVGCDDILATGNEDIKQQVWVLKKCGHVYCGECASMRVSPRGGNNRDRKKAKQAKVDGYKVCKAEGCKEKITARTAMFQLYL